MYGNSQYSHAQYGRDYLDSQRQSRDQDDSGQERPVTPKEAYGSGVALATREDVRQNRASFLWDPMPDARGGFQSEHGVSELEKDIAFRVAREGHRLRGGTLDEDAKADLEIIVERIVAEDARVLEARDVTVREGRRPDTIECEFTFVGDNGGVNDGVFPYYDGDAARA